MKETNNKKLRKLFTIWGIVSLAGMLLIAYMVKVESEPGLLPILLFLTGTIGFIYTYFKIKKHK